MDNGHAALPATISVSVTVDTATGAVTLNGPLGDPVTFGRILSAGHDALLQIVQKQAKPQPKIIAATEIPDPRRFNFGGGLRGQ